MILLYILIFLNPMTQEINTVKTNIKSKLETAHYEAQEEEWMSIKSEVERAMNLFPNDMHLEFYMAFIYDHLANFFMETDDDKADDYLDMALEHLNNSINVKETADANALFSSVLGKKIGIAPLKGMFLGSKSNSKIERALEMNSNNPRVLITDAIGKMFKPSMFGGDKEAARDLLNKAANTAETYSDNDIFMPVWGHADAYAWLANLDIIESKMESAKINADKAISIQENYGFVKFVIMPKITE